MKNYVNLINKTCLQLGTWTEYILINDNKPYHDAYMVIPRAHAVKQVTRYSNLIYKINKRYESI